MPPWVAVSTSTALERSTYDVLVHRAPVSQVAQHAADSGFDVLPSNSDLTAAEVELIEVEHKERRSAGSPY